MNSLPGAMVGFGAAVVFDMVDAEELVVCNVASGSKYIEGMISFSDYLKLIIYFPLLLSLYFYYILPKHCLISSTHSLLSGLIFTHSEYSLFNSPVIPSTAIFN